MMSQRETILRSVRFERPERIPMVFWVNPSCYNHYPKSALDELQESHACLFPGFPEDLGMQVGPMLSPEHLRKFIKPSYQRLMKPAREAGCIIHMHSDGDIRDLADDLVDSGAQVVNLQDLVNGIEWIRGRFKGRVCIDLDIDRQNVTRFGTPDEVDALIRGEVEMLMKL